MLEWTTNSVKIRLPQVELASATKADIEVVRADGSLASKTGDRADARRRPVALGQLSNLNRTGGPGIRPMHAPASPALPKITRTESKTCL